MSPQETVLFEQGDVLVTERRVVIDGIAHPLSLAQEVRVQSESSYVGKSVPFAFAVLFVLWAIGELINSPADVGMAAFAGVLALLSAAVVRLVGSFQSHTIVLTTLSGEQEILRSRDGRLVSAVVKATRLAIVRRRLPATATWNVGRAAHG
ncbi:hypothetical protein GT347_06995 [Xylophilus rhododendri]|uniref:Uncharacterized protein n=1 Tax=Xylophilus rhododendri TaxID=2697032 RepID=A0A857J4G2_9BURK|nr:DUF6232 family protein [Xylophilus rhododendri]QHI97758.1 hypothetical protein GT347_06995 [Xylophilus rhododendri]